MLGRRRCDVVGGRGVGYTTTGRVGCERDGDILVGEVLVLVIASVALQRL